MIRIISQYAGSAARDGVAALLPRAGDGAARDHVVVLSGNYSHLFARPPDASARFTIEGTDGVRYCWSPCRGMTGPRAQGES